MRLRQNDRQIISPRKLSPAHTHKLLEWNVPDLLQRSGPTSPHYTFPTAEKNRITTQHEPLSYLLLFTAYGDTRIRDSNSRSLETERQGYGILSMFLYPNWHMALASDRSALLARCSKRLWQNVRQQHPNFLSHTGSSVTRPQTLQDSQCN